MRLTLRTLLAYLDDILEPEQAREIGEKLNESSFAASLVSRIREVMRRRRLTAPTVSGAGAGIDPNAVAEYLDNTLPPDGVADVEKICLESDVQLAEVAACHQILTLALGEPVEISRDTRERMYALTPRQKSAAHSTNGSGTAGASSAELTSEALGDVLKQAETAGTRGQKSMGVQPVPAPKSFAEGVPEYLQRRSNGKRVLAYVIAALVLGGWGYLAFNNSPFGNKPSNAPSQNAETGQPLASTDTSPETAAVPDQGEPIVDASEKIPAKRNDPELVETPTVAQTEPKRSAIDAPPPPDVPDEDSAPPRKKPGALASAAKGTDSGTKKPAPAEKPAPPEPGTAIPAAPMMPPAKYTSAEGIALNYVRREDRWQVLPRRAQVHGGDQLAVPEPFEAAFDVEDGRGVLTLASRTSVRWLGPTENFAFGIEIKRGQVIVRPTGAGEGDTPPLTMGVAIRGDLWTLAVNLPGTVCGVDVSPREPTKFEQEPGKDAYFGGVYVAAGGVRLTDAAGATFEVNAGQWLQLPLTARQEGDEKIPPAAQSLLAVPKWLSPSTPTATARQYARLFEKKFDLTEPVELSIPAVASDGNPEISRLATECLSLIEAYGPLVDVLQRSQHEEARKVAISGLRQWLPQGAENRDKLKEELAQRFPPDESKAVYQLLWGYDQEDAHNRAVSLQLIDWMGHPQIAIRELAFYHVYRLTDKKFDYRPNGTPLQMQSSLNRWRQHVLKEGALLSSKGGDAATK